MTTKIICTLLIIVLYSFAGQTQPKRNYFKLSLTNNSNFTTTCTILGNDKTDSILARQTKTILFDLDKDQISFYLNLWTADLSAGSYQNKLIRILNTQKAKQITITNGNQLKYSLTPSEKIIANCNPRLRTKNFWKLDTVINANSNDIAAAEIIFLSLCDIDVKVDTIKKYYNLLTPGIKATPYGKRITNYLTARGRLNIGNKIDNFGLPDSTGKIINLNEINSDYILLDFWFSRCAPCIKSFPELQDLYSKTERKKFEIVGISIDRADENELWKNAISKYKLPWPNINDFKTVIAKTFAIVNYPTKVLIDKERKIILVDTDNSYESFYREIEKLVNGK